jgi:hypothetical protein
MLKFLLFYCETDVYRDGDRCLIAKTGCDTCPVNMLQIYITSANIRVDSKEYIFRALTFCKKDNCYKLRESKSLSYSRAREVLLNMLESIGLNKQLFGLHSLRSGGDGYS